MLLVPSISIKDGKVTRLTRGDYSSGKIYDESPIDLARQFEDHGINRLHLIDLDGAKKGTPVNYHILEMMSGYSDIAINFSGGIHTDGDVTKCFEYGAESITSATIAVYNPDLFTSWMMSYGREKIALGADTLDGLIRVGGWQKGTKVDVFEHIDHFYSRGLKYLKTTDISREGAMEGPSFELYQQLTEKFTNLSLFASGGIRNVDDIRRLNDIGVYGVIFGKAFYEGKITLKDIEGFAVAMN
ncbi:MAG: 1-(5-phosphoribosyl)-5-[(5-phosphoribosylamino)methylideneamino] imidazole-4-carboxamide isomerase [Reichenbachiella sp.]|uniref:1-(5-phosphoribosyl)-5-[(5- phosphoribosylamino)methylideneamino]imidazole-4- carboxamide isomerase n=1 Tax=Reichenbachiella sp. TaxID=2184521 RepID=UPI003266F9A6